MEKAEIILVKHLPSGNYIYRYSGGRWKLDCLGKATNFHVTEKAEQFIKDWTHTWVERKTGKRLDAPERDWLVPPQAIGSKKYKCVPNTFDYIVVKGTVTV